MTSVYFLIIVWVFFPFFAQWSCEDSNGRPVELEFGPLIFLSCAIWLPAHSVSSTSTLIKVKFLLSFKYFCGNL